MPTLGIKNLPFLLMHYEKVKHSQAYVHYAFFLFFLFSFDLSRDHDYNLFWPANLRIPLMSVFPPP